MFKLTLTKDSKLDEPIDKILAEMAEFGPGTPEYDNLLGQLERMMALQNTETWTRRINPDQVAAVAANLLGILTIVAYEQKHVMVSKALGMLTRSKHQQM